MQCNPARPNRILQSSVSKLALAVALAASLGACANKPKDGDITGSIRNPFVTADTNPRSEIERLGEAYKNKPADAGVAIAYAQALRRNEQTAQAVAVLEQATIKNPSHRALAGEYGRALAETGRLQQALEVLGRAHTPDQPDWRVLNAQGAIRSDEDVRATAAQWRACVEEGRAVCGTPDNPAPAAPARTPG